MFFKKVCSLFVSFSLLVNQIVYAGGIIVDSTVSSNHQATLKNAQNGVPIINIVNPNSSGLSHNKFKNYNVGKEGLILNNSMKVTKTQLAGYIDRNQNLSAAAKVILNEVTGTSRSLLKGYTEIAGNSAHVIVANPNGISVDGGGFINTPKATLTTGKPFFNGDILSGFNITKGDILIEGDGFNSNNIDKVNLYSKALEINAKIYANDINIVAGSNKISLDGEITSLEKSGSGVSIDSSLLGGIYANTIILDSNDKGVGVNLPPEVIAQKNLVINANGEIILNKVIANEDIQIEISGGDIISKDEFAAQNIVVKSTNDLIVETQSIIESSENIEIEVNSITNNGEIRATSSTSNANITANQKISNNNNIYSKNDLVLTGKEIENNAMIQADNDLTVEAENITNNLDGTVYAQNKISLSSDNIVNNGIIATDTLDIKTKNIENKGALYSKKDMTIEANSLTNSEMIRSNEEINLLISNTLDNEKNGIIYTVGNINISANESKEKINTVTNEGVIQSHSNINVTAKTLNNTTNAPVYTTKSTSNTKKVSKGDSNSYDIVTTTVSTDILTIPNDPALMLAQGDITIDVDTLNNYYSLISSDQNIILDANTANNVGKVAVTTTTTVTKQYRKEKYCSRKICGSCISHKNRAGYRGTFTSTQTSKVPAVSYGIQAKRTMTGNVITLNNVNSNQEILNEQEVIEKQNEIDTVASNNISFQDSIGDLDANNVEILLTITEIEDMEDKLNTIETDEDFTTFKTDLESIKNALSESITKDQETIDSLETVIAYTKTLDSSETLNQEIHSLENSLISLNSNLEENQINLNTLNVVDSELNILSDIELQKQALIDLDINIKNIINNNATLISDLETTSLLSMTEELDSIHNSLSNNLQTTLAEQSATKQTVISKQGAIFETTNSPILQTVSDVTIDTNSNDVISKLTLPKNKFGLFTLNTNPNHTFLIESNPLYANYQNFISSDYMMGQLNYDPTKTIQRLGDAMYETTLIRNSIINLSGQRYLEGYDSDLSQYKGLMDNAIEVQADLNLSFGVTLSKNQINQLTKDIVWMEEKIVEGQKVLVPVVYLASLDANNLKDGTQIIAGEDIALTTTGTLQNQGKIESQNDLSITSNNIINQGGTLEAKNDAVLQSNKDIVNTSGDIKAGNDLTLIANNNINIESSTNKEKYKYDEGYQSTTFKGKASNIEAGGSLLINATNSLTVKGSNLKAKEDATLVANNGNINIGATEQKEKFDFDVYGGYYRGDSLKNSGSNVKAKNLTVLTNGNLNIEGSKVKAEETANIYANNVNITSTTDTSSSEYKSESKGFFSSYSTKQEKNSSTNISSILEANNVNIDTGNLTLIASKIKANEAQITADIINLISSKDSEYESNFTDSSGMFLRTIETQGHIKEILKVANIEVSDKLVVNGKDITEQLSTDKIIKTLSSQSNLSIEQINLVKATLNNKDWNDKTTTLSGVGSLIVAIVVTVLTAGAGTALVGAAGTAAAGTTAAAVQSAVVQSIVSGVTTQLTTSAITGNSFKLDEKSLLKGAVSAGVMSYAGSMIDTSLGLENVDVADMSYTQQFQQGVLNTVVRSAVDSAMYGTDFKDSLTTGLITNVSNLGFRAVGDTSMSQYLGEDNTLFKDGAVGKIALHSLVGAGTAELLGQDATAGAVAAGVNELVSPLYDGLENNTQIQVSGLTGGLSAGIVGGESQISTGQTIAQSATEYNRQLHAKEIKFIEDNAKDFADLTIVKNTSGNESLMDESTAKRLLTQAALYYNDEDTQNNINDDLNYVNQTEFSQEQLANAYQYLKEETVDNIFADNYNQQELSTQQYFTSTPSQYEDNSYNPNQLLGLGYGDLIMIPTFKGGSTILNTTTEIAPSVFNGGKTIINTVNKKADGIYDDVTLGTINQINNISPSVGNVLLDTRVVLPVIGTGEVINDYYNDSSPIPSTLFGTIFSGKKNLQDLINDENKMNDIKNWVGLENSKESNN